MIIENNRYDKFVITLWTKKTRSTVHNVVFLPWVDLDQVLSFSANVWLIFIFIMKNLLKFSSGLEHGTAQDQKSHALQIRTQKNWWCFRFLLMSLLATLKQ